MRVHRSNGAAALGSALQGGLGRFFTEEESKLLLVAGAAACVAAIFKAQQLTGLVFALERRRSVALVGHLGDAMRVRGRPHG